MRVREPDEASNHATDRAHKRASSKLATPGPISTHILQTEDREKQRKITTPKTRVRQPDKVNNLGTIRPHDQGINQTGEPGAHVKHMPQTQGCEKQLNNSIWEIQTRRETPHNSVTKETLRKASEE